MAAFPLLFNAVLLALPVGTTVGVLVGIDLHRQSTGQAPIFNGDTGLSGGAGNGAILPPGGIVTIENGITEHMYCQKSVAVSPASRGSRYTMNPNQWGWTEGTPGGMCMNITTFQNNTYATATTAPEFSVTWQYPPGTVTQPVHAFPNIHLDRVLPLRVSSMRQVNIDLRWSYGIGNEVVASTDEAELTANAVNTNVAVDMFLDNDADTSLNSSLAAYEVMVWFAGFGPSTQPIGLERGSVATESIAGTTFDLYTGVNVFQQNVLTWVAANTTEAFTGDLLPLVSRLSSVPNVVFPASTLQLGNFGLGSEAFSSNVNVTFSVPVLSIDIETS